MGFFSCYQGHYWDKWQNLNKASSIVSMLIMVMDIMSATISNSLEKMREGRGRGWAGGNKVNMVTC